MAISDTEDDYEMKDKIKSESEDDDSRKMSSSKHGREEEGKCSHESKKLKKMAVHWNWTDECTILMFFYEFAGKNGIYSKEFHDFVKKELSVEVSNSQLSDKVNRLKKRFLEDKRKMEDGKMKFSNANCEKLFELSSKIWGGGGSPPNQWKPEKVDGFYEKMFKSVFESCKLDISCIPSNLVKDIRKDWEDMKTAEYEYKLKKAKLCVEISDIRCSQNKS